MDELVGIKPHERMRWMLLLTLLMEATEAVIEKGEKASCEDIVSKQAVMNKVHTVEVKPLTLKDVEERG